MNCQILNQIKDAFGSLWSCDPLDDKSVRITTPYASLNNKYIDLIVMMQGDEYVVTDGGYVDDAIGLRSSKFIDTILVPYLEEFEIQVLENQKKIYYKKTADLDFVPNCVFEMADFARAMLSASYIDVVASGQDALSDNVEEVEFQRRAKEYLKDSYEDSNYALNFKQKIGLEGRKKKFSAVIATPSEENVIQFLSGGTFYHFKSHITNTMGDFDLLEDYTPLNLKLALYDDRVDIYKDNRDNLHEYLNLLRSRLTHDPVPWSEKDRIKELLPI